MEFLAQLHHPQPLHHSINCHRPPFLKPISFLSVATFPSWSSPSKFNSIRASSSSPSPLHHNHNHNHKPSPFQSLALLTSPILKTTCIAILSAALISTRLHHKPAIAASPPIVNPHYDPTDDPPFPSAKSELAEAELLSHLKSNPNDIEALEQLADLRVDVGKFTEAIEAIDRLIELQPDEMEWQLWKSNVHFYDEEYESAMKGYQQVLEKDPVCSGAFSGLIASARECDYPVEEIVKKLEEAVERCMKENDTENARSLRILIGEAHFRERNFEIALKVLEEVAREEPTDCRPYVFMGLIHTVMMNRDKADKNFANYAKYVPSDHPYKEDFDADIKAIKGFGNQLEMYERKEGRLV